LPRRRHRYRRAIGRIRRHRAAQRSAVIAAVHAQREVLRPRRAHLCHVKRCVVIVGGVRRRRSAARRRRAACNACQCARASALSASVCSCREAARLCASRASCAPGCTAHCEPPTARVVASPLGTSVSARIGGVVAVSKPAQQQSSGTAAREHTRSATAPPHSSSGTGAHRAAARRRASTVFCETRLDAAVSLLFFAAAARDVEHPAARAVTAFAPAFATSFLHGCKLAAAARWCGARRGGGPGPAPPQRPDASPASHLQRLASVDVWC
jgi:hypothetical protein